MKDMKLKKIKTKALIITLTLFISIGCSHKLSETFYQSPSDILFQQSCTYYSKGYVARANDRYEGVLAIVSDTLIFEPLGPGSSPNLKILEPIILMKSIIDSAVYSDRKTFRTKVLTVYTYKKQYEFHIAKADTISAMINKWLAQE